MKMIYVVSLLLFEILLLSPGLVSARSGCCSHHGGVCGCGCCDGTSLSATCAPYYPGCGGGGGWTIPSPVSMIPPDTNGSFNYFKNNTGGVDLVFDWDRPDNTAYSIVLSKIAGGDPGPNADVYNSKYTFSNVKPGKWYVNVKEAFGSQWSRISYWTVDIPSNVNAIARAYPTPTPRPSPSPTLTTFSNEDSSDDWWVAGLLGLVGVGAYRAVSQRQKS